MAAARESLYRPGADQKAVDDFEALRSSLQPETPDRSPPSAEAVDSTPRRGTIRRPFAWALVGLLVGIACGVPLGALTRAAAPSTRTESTQEQVARRVLDSSGSLTAQDYYRLYPDDLPIQWGGASTGTAFRHLAREERLPLLPASDSSALLIVPGCPIADVQFNWLLTAVRSGRAVGSGTGSCGRLEGDIVDLPSSTRGEPLMLQTRVGKALAYSVTVLER